MKYLMRITTSICILLTVVMNTEAIFEIDSLEEEIRRRIENIEISNQVDEQEKIYAIQSIMHIYIENDFKPVWNKENEIARFLKAVENSSLEGLTPTDYHFDRLTKLQQLTNLTLSLEAERDLLLTDAFLLYATHLLSGKVNPVTIDANWHVVRNEGDPLALFMATIKSNNYTSAIEKLAPSNSKYTDLKDALIKYRKIQEEGGWKSIPAGKVIETGMSDSRIPLIRERLLLTNDYKKFDDSDSDEEYSAELREAVLILQRRHGFNGDGKVDEPTIRAMNVPVEERIKQIETNLERWRWLPQEFSKYYILVNIANYDLQVIKDGRIERTHRVIAGKPVRKTPVFSSTVSYLVLNPTWTVPPTILKNDVIPEVRKSTQYLKDRNIRVLDAKGSTLNVDSINWNSNTIYSLVYRQDPGPKNALGAVKFMFPNKFSVYIHDTPSRELFTKSERAFSSGCIRVEDPLAMAEYLLNDPSRWNTQSIKKVVDSNITQTVFLKNQPNVHILYWTCWADKGLVQFRKDIYERDEQLYKAFKQPPRIDTEQFAKAK